LQKDIIVPPMTSLELNQNSESRLGNFVVFIPLILGLLAITASVKD
jgi:hypothetical protein